MNFETLKNNLEERGYTVSCHKTAKEAAEYINKKTDGTSVGMGGSITLEQMGLYDMLLGHNVVHWHQHTPKDKTSAEVRIAASGAEIYISSVNGLAETGEIINIDGTCNRVASIFFGHKKVYLVVGKNKIAKNYDEALWRARNIAAPKNARRLGVNTPCAKDADRCYNCKSPQRICRALCVLWEKPMGSDIEIVLIDEELGY